MLSSVGGGRYEIEKRSWSLLGVVATGMLLGTVAEYTANREH